MKRSILIVVLGALGALASCVAPPAASPRLAPIPAPRPAPRPVPPAVTQPLAPPEAGSPRSLTPGTWAYASGEAQFGTGPASIRSGPRVRLSCERGAILLRVARPDATAAAPSMTLRATTTLRTVAAQAETEYTAARFVARDPLLDALAFSRGRFGLIVDGVELTLPAWPEIARVLEDCRA